MIRHCWTVLSQSALIDTQTNLLSLFNIWEGVTSLETPSQQRPLHLPFEIVSMWFNDEKKLASGDAQVFILSPDNTKSPPVMMGIEIDSIGFQRTRLTANPIGFKSFGVYNFCVEFRENATLDWQTVASVPFMVNEQPGKIGIDNSVSP